ncbi:autotransporter domain-containing protein [Aquibium sp. ELW1220]|uniref:autotransporter domain-containing protein n=1 Tax=Aquibium sp. ELW1220 TaxID=2976766 RepID=UPI0025B03C53|nr:autotransporter domain-containing protein [Aquibium sp. ELW1220]MDN2580994.1 autotransporter domain-containing protein [Aquibium sp. ELW1220]
MAGLSKAAGRKPARRRSLLSGAALTTVFLCLGAPGSAQAACSIDGTTQTCTGLLGDGVAATSPVETLLINNVTGKIWPDNAGVNAIDFQSSGPITITSDTGSFETIAVDADGIYANSTGGSITIDHEGEIVSTGGFGVRTLSQDDTSVDLIGDISGTLGGISAYSEFGDVSVYSNGDVTSSAGSGIVVDAPDGDAELTGGGDVEAYGDGLFAQSTGQNGDGSATIEWDGTVTSEMGKGVYAYSALDAVLVDQYGAIDSYGDGIFAENRNAESVTVDHTGDIDTTRGTGRGIYAYSSMGQVSVTMSGGDITSADDGIFAENRSGASVSVDMTGMIDAGGKGVYAYSSSGAVTVNQYGALTSTGTGIFAQNYGSATVTIDRTGNLNSTSSDGIYAYSATGAIGVTMSGGDISASGYGIFAQNYGSTAIDIDLVGGITAGNDGIFASSATGNIDIGQHGLISASNDGIFTRTSDTGTITIDRSGDIVAASGKGIYADAVHGAIDITTIGDITAGAEGIYARAAGGGSVTIDLTGDILQSTTGISATSADGAILIDVYGDVTSSGRGIYASSSNAAVTVNQYGSIQSGDDGIFASTTGDDDGVTIDQDGAITSTGGRGIYASSADGPITITRDYGDISSSSTGIFARNTSTGTIDITSAGNIASTSGYGIFAETPAGSIEIRNQGDIASYSDGIFARTYGTDKNILIEQAGDITSSDRDGIYAYTTDGSIMVTMTSGDIDASGDGIFAKSLSDDAITIVQTGDILAGSNGIFAESAAGQISVTHVGIIDADNSHGIFASTNGTDKSVTVQQTGDVSSANFGIYAYAKNGAVTVTVASGNIDAGGTGIFAENVSSETVSVTQTGTIDAGSNGIGVYAVSRSGAVVVNQYGAIDSGRHGVFATTMGNGKSITIDRTGDITSETGNGIYAYTSNGPITITMVSGDISSYESGIFAEGGGDGAITISHTGTIDAETKYGIYAETASGAVSVTQFGGVSSVLDGIYARNISGDSVTVDTTGDISSSTRAGIQAYSGSGTITISYDDGTVSGAQDAIHLRTWGTQSVTIGSDGAVLGGAGFTGVYFEQANYNNLYNYGTIASADGIAGMAVQADRGDTLIDNYGTITGNIDLYEWSNAFNNRSGALFNMGSMVNLDGGNVLTNWGTLSPGGDDNVFTTTLTGVLVNEATGTLLFDIDMDATTADRIDVSETAALDGDLQLNFITANGTPDTYTIVTTANGVTSQTLTLLNPFVLADINTVNGGDDVELSIDGFDFSPAGMGDNASSIGNAIQASIEGPGGLEPLAVALLNLGSVDEGEDALNQLSPNIYVADQIAAVQDIDTFSDAMLSCRMAGGENAFAAEGECAWGRAVYSEYDLQANGDLTGFNTRSTEVMGGVQMAIDGTPWRIGGSIGYRSSDRDGDGGASSEGDSFSAGAVVKYAPGPLLLAASLSASHGSYDTLRPIAFGNFTDLLSGETDVTTVSGRLRAAYTMQTGGFYLRPMVDASVTYVKTGAFTESGGLASVSTDGVDNTVLALMPAVEIGGQVELGGDILLRPYLRGGVGLYTGNDYSLTGVFNADGNAATAFTIGTSSEDVLWTVSAGVDILKGDMGTLQIFYEGAFGQDTTINAGGAKFSVNF